MWGYDLYQSRSFPVNPQYPQERVEFNYWDYIDAWTNTFYVRNPNGKHTWFLRLSQDLLTTKIPSWFLLWWDKFGLEINILPKEIFDLFDIWCEYHPKFFNKENIPKGLKSLTFFIQYEFPWIFKWDLSTGVDHLQQKILQRTFWYKWWPKYDEISSKEEQISEDIRVNMRKANQVKFIESPQASNPFEAMKLSLQKQFPNLSEDKIVVKCMDAMKASFLQSSLAKAVNEDVIMTNASTSSSDCLPGESQEDEPIDTNLGDFWDSMTAVLEGQLKRRASSKEN